MDVGRGVKFYFGSGRLCLDFVRTVRARRGSSIEGLQSSADLERWIDQAGLPLKPRRQPVKPDHVIAAHQLREAIYQVVDSARLKSQLSKFPVTLLNRYAAQPLPFPQLSAATGQLSWSSVASINAVFASLARDTLDLVGSEGILRVRECADPGCTSLFFDTSRSANRKWCSAMPCANRNKVRAYRSRKGAPAALRDEGENADPATKPRRAGGDPIGH
jgi:predicted RNA-binding Zn ribbon-like protein